MKSCDVKMNDHSRGYQVVMMTEKTAVTHVLPYALLSFALLSCFHSRIINT